jgi:hypothetical protein
MTQTPIHITQYSKHYIKRTPATPLNTPYILGISTADVTETPSTNDHDGRPPNNKLPFQQKHSGQPHIQPKIERKSTNQQNRK